MVHYTGYDVGDLSSLSRQLNAAVQQRSSSNMSLKTVYMKYSHRYSTFPVCCH